MLPIRILLPSLKSFVLLHVRAGVPQKRTPCSVSLADFFTAPQPPTVPPVPPRPPTPPHRTPPSSRKHAADLSEHPRPDDFPREGPAGAHEEHHRHVFRHGRASGARGGGRGLRPSRRQQGGGDHDGGGCISIVSLYLLLARSLACEYWPNRSA